MASQSRKQYSESEILDGVPFRLDPRLSAVSNYDFSRVNEILSRPLPTAGLSEMCDNLLANIGVVEAQVLKQLEDIENEKNARFAKEKRELEELEERRRLAEIEAREKDDGDDVNDKNEDDATENSNSSSPQDTETEPSTASIADPPPALAILPATITSNVTAMQQSSKPTSHINFSEFEAESDPFEKAELQTLNDLQELAAVLQTTAPATYPTSTPATFASSSTSSSGPPPPTYEMATTGAISRYPYYPVQPGQFQYQPLQQGVLYQQQPSTGHPPPPLPAAGQSDMKSSKSLGDIMVEIQKEAEAFEKLKIIGHQRKNSRTPPPRTSVTTNERSGNADDWIPWPDIDAPTQKQQQPEILRDLNPESQNICCQISEMGFALERVAKGCKSFGDDRQKIINYCLMVEDMVNEVGKSSAEEVEYVIPIHNMDKDVSMKHLKAFFRLQELGFNRIAIHDALMTAKLDHDKALEKLLR